MRVIVDASEVHSLTAAAEQVLGTSGERMHAILESAAADERASHDYTNRTHNLEDSTFATELEGSADEQSVEIGARTFYASFVEARGFQDIELKIADAEVAIETMFDVDAEHLAGL